MESLSWKRYDDKYKLSHILTLAARSCVDVRAARPAEYLAAYFTKNCTGDEIKSISAHPLYLPSNNNNNNNNNNTSDVPAVEISLYLLNGMEFHSTAILKLQQQQQQEEVEGGGGGGSSDEFIDPAISAIEILKQSYIPQLLQCGASKQEQFDEILCNINNNSEDVKFESSVLYALSIAAAGAAAKCSSLPIYQYIRNSFILSDNNNNNETFTIPQICINFFGPENISTARVAIKDVVLIPSMPEGIVQRSVIQKIFVLFRYFSRTHNCSIRSDGSLAFDGFENLIDAVNVAEEAIRAVGLIPVEEICIGIRLGAVAVYIPSNNNNNNNNNNTGKEIKESTDVMYALFPGDVEVSGVQIAEYIREQLLQRTEFVIYIENTHNEKDIIGLRRLQARMGNTLTISGPNLYSNNNNNNNNNNTEGIWEATNVVLQPTAVGTISNIISTLRRVRESNGRSASISTFIDSYFEGNSNSNFSSHLAVGLGARFICIGGLRSPAACLALSELIYIQDELQNTHNLSNEMPGVCCLDKLPEISNDVVPEIRRKLEKKKRKK